MAGNRFFLPLLAAVLFALLPAQADAIEIIEFDPTGQGGATGSIAIGGLKFAPGNALAIDALPIGTPSAPSAFTTFYQTTLEAFLDADGNPIPNTGLGTDFQITVQAGMPELGALSDSTIAFGHDPDGPVNFLRLYFNDSATATAPDPATGIGFDTGQVILEAVFTGNDTVFVFDPAAAAPLDLAGTDDQPGVGSVVGSGGGPIFGEVVDTDDAFFVGDELTEFVLQTMQTTPFTLVEPTGPLTADIANGGGVVGNFPEFFGNLPPLAGVFPSGVNGLPIGCTDAMPCDVLLQSETTLLFGRVPEPAGLAVGAGLIALGCALGRRSLRRAEAQA